MQNVDFFFENLENILWSEIMYFLPIEGDFISNDEKSFVVIGRFYASKKGEDFGSWCIFLKEVE